ncbi:Cytochrome b-c1 complex subunit 7 [Ascosphaera acerosa]|nr:Cytochrome b-c1 complex subunit 7 [Ascosphaera acerosa]
MSAPSLYKQVVARPWLRRMLQPVASWYTDAAGYRKMGLKSDDLIPEESETVQTALHRLPPKEAYDRIYPSGVPRGHPAHVLTHTQFGWPADQTQDKEYLGPIIREIEAEKKERQELDNLVLKR